MRREEREGHLLSIVTAD